MYENRLMDVIAEIVNLFQNFNLKFLDVLIVNNIKRQQC